MLQTIFFIALGVCIVHYLIANNLTVDFWRFLRSPATKVIAWMCIGIVLWHYAYTNNLLCPAYWASLIKSNICSCDNDIIEDF